MYLSSLHSQGKLSKCHFAFSVQRDGPINSKYWNVLKVQHRHWTKFIYKTVRMEIRYRSSLLKSLYRPALKTMVLYKEWYMGHSVDHGYSVHNYDRLMYWQMHVCNMFELPNLTQRLLSKKNKKSHL